MKTIAIDPNQIRDGVANFTIDYRFKKIPVIDGGAACQRFLRLTEIPLFNTEPKRTAWHEIYSENLSAARFFKKWVKQKGRCFQWKGNVRDLGKLNALMSGT